MVAAGYVSKPPSRGLKRISRGFLFFGGKSRKAVKPFPACQEQARSGARVRDGRKATALAAHSVLDTESGTKGGGMGGREGPAREALPC